MLNKCRFFTIYFSELLFSWNTLYMILVWRYIRHIAAYTYTKRMLKEHLPANLVCLPNGFVKNCLASTHGECEQTNTSHNHWRRTNIRWHSLNLPTSEGTLLNANEGICHHSFTFAVPSTYPYFRQTNAFICRSFGVCLVYVYEAYEESKCRIFLIRLKIHIKWLYNVIYSGCALEKVSLCRSWKARYSYILKKRIKISDFQIFNDFDKKKAELLYGIFTAIR